MLSLLYLVIRVLARLLVTSGLDDGSKDLETSFILGRRHLDRTLRSYADQYNRGRPHRALALATQLAEPQDPIPASPRDVRRRDLLGGLIHEHHGLAA